MPNGAPRRHPRTGRLERDNHDKPPPPRPASESCSLSPYFPAGRLPPGPAACLAHTSTDAVFLSEGGVRAFCKAGLRPVSKLPKQRFSTCLNNKKGFFRQIHPCGPLNGVGIPIFLPIFKKPMPASGSPLPAKNAPYILPSFFAPVEFRSRRLTAPASDDVYPHKKTGI